MSEKGPADVYLRLLQSLVSPDDGVGVGVKGRGHTSWEELAKKHVYQLDKTSVRLGCCDGVCVCVCVCVCVSSCHNYLDFLKLAFAGFYNLVTVSCDTHVILM